MVTATQDGYRALPVEAIQPTPDHPRKNFDEDALEELATSIRQFGLLQPIVVRPRGDGYKINEGGGGGGGGGGAGGAGGRGAGAGGGRAPARASRRSRRA